MIDGLADELSNHVGTLLVIVAWMSGVIGILLGAVCTIFWHRQNYLEGRQVTLREKVIPNMVTKADFHEGIEAIKEIAQLFVSRVEGFMNNCSEGKCVVARLVATYHPNGALDTPNHQSEHNCQQKKRGGD